MDLFLILQILNFSYPSYAIGLIIGICVIHSEDSSFVSYECRNIYGEMDVKKSGDDFFAESKTDILEKSVQANIDNGMDYLPFALLVCDANDLKKINDTQGHAAGDEYIRKASRLLCSTFVHSLISEIFDRADKEMYKNKRNIKKEKQILPGQLG